MAVIIPKPAGGAPTAEDLDFRTAIAGDGLLLTEGDRSRFGLYAQGPKGPRRIGTYSDVRDAWRAVDAIDLENG